MTQIHKTTNSVAELTNVDMRHLPKILIVEDDSKYALILMRAIKDPISKVQFDVQIATSVEQALSYVERDNIDIYIVDLGLPMKEGGGASDVERGMSLVQRITDSSNAGIIVHTNVSMRDRGEDLYDLGADDYLEKRDGAEIVRAKANALWRRLKMSRSNPADHFVHTNRVFRIGLFQFVIGERDVKTQSGHIVRLSATEHAFLKYLCTVEDHEIDQREFNSAILERPTHVDDRRLHNLVYRMREKLGDSFQLVSKREGNYKLLDVKELQKK